jgi:hypothetical protein
MSRYHIALRTESHVASTVEVDMPDSTALRSEVARFVGEILKDHAEQIWIDEDWRVDVLDETGLILFVMRISAERTAATMPAARLGPNTDPSRSRS